MLSACEFRFIKRIGAHGKQNPGFICIIVIISEAGAPHPICVKCHNCICDTTNPCSVYTEWERVSGCQSTSCRQK